jgi:tetratricopeptide (TPR) repeat protein
MRKIKLFFLLYFYIASANAQANGIDDLKQLLQKTKADTSRVLLLEDLSRIYSISKTDTSLLLAQQALSLARKIGFEKGEAISLNRIGTVLSSIGNHPQALENLLEALRINEKINNLDGIMRNQGNISNVNAELGDYREALKYAFKGMHNAEKAADEERLINALLRIGDGYEKLDILDSARLFTQRAFDLSIKLKDDYSTGIALNNFGNIYYKMKKPDDAMKYYRASLAYYESDEDDEGIAESTLGMARLFKNTSQNDSALYYAKRSLDAANHGGFTLYKLDASQFLSDHFEAKNKPDSAFHYQKITIAAKDSLFNQEKIKRVQTLSFEERKREQLLEEKKASDEKEQQNNIQLMGIASVLVVLFLLLVLISRKQTNARTVEVYGLISLLFLFEFIYLLINPFVEKLTNHTPVFMLLILAGVAAILIPLHHKMEKWIKTKLADKIRYSDKSSPANTRRVDSEIQY